VQASLKRLAREQGISGAEIIRQAIDRYTRELRFPRRDPAVREEGQAFILSRSNKGLCLADGPGAERSCLSDKVLVDTNVLVCAYDRSEPEKQRRALEVLDRLAISGAGVISTQVLSEFFIVVTGKIVALLSAAEAYDRVKNYLQIWTLLDLTGMIVLKAARGVRDHQCSFRDAQI